MKRLQIIVSLAVLASLAAGGAQWVFGQRQFTPVIPPEPPKVTTLPVEVVPPSPLEVPIPVAPSPPLPKKEIDLELPVPPRPVAVVQPPSSEQYLPTQIPVERDVQKSTQKIGFQMTVTDDEARVVRKAPNEASKSAPRPEATTSRQEPSVCLEWFGPATARLNQATNYQLIAKNVSGTQVNNVSVRYPIPAGVKIVSSEPPAKAVDGCLTWELGTLNPAQEKRIDMQLLPEAKAAISCQAAVTFTASSTLQVQVREPKLAVKMAVPERVVLGDVAMVSMTVSNPGDGPVDHVKVKAQVPEGLEHARGKMFEQDLGTLAPGENRTVQLVCLAKLAGAQQVDCVAMADAGLTAKDAGKVDVILPKLDLTVTGPKLRYLDRHATYIVRVTNPGSAPAGNVSILHQLPQGFKFQSASSGGRHDFATRSVSWFVGDLTPGESREVTLEVIPTSVGDLTQTTVATAARGLKSECEVVTHVEGLSALLMELVDTEDPIEVGAETAYEIRVTNTGSKTETNLTLTCTLPEKMEFRSAKCAADCKFRVEGREVIFEPLPRLAPRADVVYRVTVRGIAPGDLRFRARIQADGLSEPVLREESTKVYGDEVIPR